MPERLPDHFHLAPSSSARWIPCPGSLLAPDKDDGGEEAKRGTLGHTMVEAHLSDRLGLSIKDGQYLHSLPQDVKDFLQWAVEICVNYVQQLDADRKLYETKIQHYLIPNHGGTVDVIAYFLEARLLHVTDFKFGRRNVDAENNTQLMCYLNLARQLFPEAEQFKGTIIQPKLSSVPDTALFTREQLDDHEAAVLEASMSDRVQAGDHCTFCSLLTKCPAAAKRLQEDLKQFPDLTKMVSEIDPLPNDEQLELLCKMYRTFKIAEKGVEKANDVLKQYIARGANTKQFGIGLRTANYLCWKKDAMESLKKKGFDAQKFTKVELVTPNQAIEALGMTKEEFIHEYGDAVEFVPRKSLILGKDAKEFPEFDDLT